MTLQSHAWACIQRKTWSERRHASQCPLQHCLQQPCHGINLSVHWQRNAQRCGAYIQRNDIQPKKEWNDGICSNTDGPRGSHTEWSTSDRRGQVLYDIPYMRNLKRNDTNEFTYKKRLTELVAGGRMRQGIVRRFGMNMFTLLYLKWTMAQGTLLNVTWQPGWEGRLGEKGYMCMYGRVPSLFTWSYHIIVC